MGFGKAAKVKTETLSVQMLLTEWREKAGHQKLTVWSRGRQESQRLLARLLREVSLSLTCR